MDRIEVFDSDQVSLLTGKYALRNVTKVKIIIGFCGIVYNPDTNISSFMLQAKQFLINPIVKKRNRSPFALEHGSRHRQKPRRYFYL